MIYLGTVWRFGALVAEYFIVDKLLKLKHNFLVMWVTLCLIAVALFILKAKYTGVMKIGLFKLKIPQKIRSILNTF